MSNLVQLAITLGLGQAEFLNYSLLRNRGQGYLNYDYALDTRLAYAANVLGRWVWPRAPMAMVDAFCGDNERGTYRISRGVGFRVGWPSEGDRWFLSMPVNLLQAAGA